MAPPVIVLGVGRSGTTLLRVMLDRNSELAIPYESFFVTPLAHRHGRRPNLDDFLDDLGRFYQLYEWGISPGGRSPAAARGDDDRRGDRRGLRGVRRARGKAALGRQDAALHAASAAARAALPGRALGASGSRRPRRRALVPRAARGLLGQDVGAAAHRRPVRGAVADGDPRRAAARRARRRPLPRAPLRGSRRRARARAAPRLRARVAAVGAGDARLHGHLATSPRCPSTGTSRSRRHRGYATGAAR